MPALRSGSISREGPAKLSPRREGPRRRLSGLLVMAVRHRKDIVLVGARGQAKDLIGLLEDDGRFRIVCLIDEIEATQLLGHEVVRPEAYDGGCRDALLAI